MLALLVPLWSVALADDHVDVVQVRSTASFTSLSGPGGDPCDGRAALATPCAAHEGVAALYALEDPVSACADAWVMFDPATWHAVPADGSPFRAGSLRWHPSDADAHGPSVFELEVTIGVRTEPGAPEIAVPVTTRWHVGATPDAPLVLSMGLAAPHTTTLVHGDSRVDVTLHGLSPTGHVDDVVTALATGANGVSEVHVVASVRRRPVEDVSNPRGGTR